VAQKLRALLKDLANTDESFDDLRQQWEDDPSVVQEERGLTDRQVDIAIRGNPTETRQELVKEWKADGETGPKPTVTARVIIDN